MSLLPDRPERAIPVPRVSATPLRTRLDGSTRPAVLYVSGEVDASTQEPFRAALADAAARHGRLVVDLGEVTHLSGGALGLLHRHRGDLVAVFVAEGSVIARALSYAGFSRWVPVLAGAPAPAPSA